MKRYFKSLDSLVIAAELSALGRKEEAMQFLTAATKMPEYAEMVEALTEDQEDLKAQDQQQQQEQASLSRTTPRLSAALARVLGETASEYPDADLWEDDELKDENDKLEEGSEQQESQGSDSAQDDDTEDDIPDFSQEDLGIDLDEQDDDGVAEQQDEVASEDDEQQDEDEQQQEQANTVTAALRVVEQAAFGGVGGTHAPAPVAKPRVLSPELQARLARNRAARV